MRKIWILGLEPLETRYTGEWYPQFEKTLKDFHKSVDYEFIHGERIQMDLKSKFFLDPLGTNIWKCTQMAEILKRFDGVDDGDVILTWDFWHPGLECLAYARSFLGKKFFIAGIAHAGTYDPWDLTYQIGMGQYGKFFEEGWFKILDAVFVATNFHKDLILKTRLIEPEKIWITGLPVDLKNVGRFAKKWKDKKDQIVFTGRKSKEKGYEQVLYLKNTERLPIVIALDLGLSKAEYHKLLGESKVVFAPSKQETFGYGIVEGIANGCIPVVPDALSFQDYVLSRYRYPELTDIINWLLMCLEDLRGLDPKQVEAVKKYDYKTAIGNMIDVMRRL